MTYFVPMFNHIYTHKILYRYLKTPSLKVHWARLKVEVFMDPTLKWPLGGPNWTISQPTPKAWLSAAPAVCALPKPHTQADSEAWLPLSHMTAEASELLCLILVWLFIKLFLATRLLFLKFSPVLITLTLYLRPLIAPASYQFKSKLPGLTWPYPSNLILSLDSFPHKSSVESPKTTTHSHAHVILLLIHFSSSETPSLSSFPTT